MTVQLICAGYAKSGTTMMHKMFEDHSPITVPWAKKEIKHFLEDRTDKPEAYFHQFNKTGEPMTTFEASPQYLTAMPLDVATDILKRIKATLPNPKLVICLRHPLYRAFSHYVHNLQFFSRFGDRHNRPRAEDARFKKLYQRSFFDAMALEENIGTRYFQKCLRAVEIFGAENVNMFFLEYHTAQAPVVSASLSAMLELDTPMAWDSFDRVYEGARFPAYHLAVNEPLEIKVGKKTSAIPKNSAYIACDVENLLVRNLNKAKLQRLRRSENRWTRGLSQDVVESVYNRSFREDFERTLELAESISNDMNLMPFYKSLPLTAKTVRKATPKPIAFKRLTQQKTKRADGKPVPKKDQLASEPSAN
jgi:hypothetical protein